VAQLSHMQERLACDLSARLAADGWPGDQHKILAWIRSGQLHAVNVGDGAQRPRFRISEADLQLFLESRSAVPAPKITRCRRRKDPSVREYF
jgi:hypothetical protein